MGNSSTSEKKSENDLDNPFPKAVWKAETNQGNIP